MQTGNWGGFAAGIAGGLIGGYIGGGIADSMIRGWGTTFAQATFAQGFAVGAVEGGLAGFGAGFGGVLGSGSSIGQAFKAGAIGGAIGAVTGGIIEGSYAAKWQNLMHGVGDKEWNKQAWIGRMKQAELALNVVQGGTLVALANPVTAPVGAAVLAGTGVASFGLGVGETALDGDFSHVGWGVADLMGGRTVGKVGSGLAGFGEEVGFHWSNFRYLSEETGRFVTNIYGQGATAARAASGSIYSSFLNIGKSVFERNNER